MQSGQSIGTVTGIPFFNTAYKPISISENKRKRLHLSLLMQQLILLLRPRHHLYAKEAV